MDFRRAEFQIMIVHCERWGNEGGDRNVHDFQRGDVSLDFAFVGPWM